MKWLKNFLGKLTAPEEGPQEDVEEDSVALDDVEQWLDGLKAKEFDGSREEIEDCLASIAAQKDTLAGHLKDLESAELHNPDIPAREKQIMEGNRSSYVKQHDLFIQYLKPPKELTMESVSEFADSVQEQIDRMVKSTAKGHIILDQFFGDIAKLLNKDMKIISESVASLKRLTSGSRFGADSMAPVKAAIHELKAKRKLSKDITFELSTLKKKRASSDALLKKIEAEIEELKKTEGYQKFSASNAAKDSLLAERKGIENDISGLFSQIDRALRKYERIIVQDAEIFQGYLRNPVEALEEDSALRIVSILQHMRKLVADETLGFKDKEKDKVLARIDMIAAERLRVLRDSHRDISGRITSVMHEVSQSDVLRELDDRNYKIEHAKNQLQILEEKIEAAERAKDKIDIEGLRKSAVAAIKEKLGIEVSISWD